VVMVQLTPDVVQLGIGQDIVPVEWEEMGGLLERTRIMAAITPIVKSDSSNGSGIVHYSA
jgi:hypothetical protein